jgi:glycosyltransferase involved in cell wall biosynthesis
MLDSPLQAALLLGGFGLFIELVGTSLKTLSVRRVTYGGSLFLTAFSAAILLAEFASPVVIAITIIAIYRIINATRVLGSPMHVRHAYVVTKRTTFVLAVSQLSSVIIWQVSEYFGISTLEWLIILLTLAFIVSCTLYVFTYFNLKNTLLRPSDQFIPDMELPSLSICLPARNETEDLPACLETILASDYPKLEVLVLDDCSQDKTSEIIRTFAQRGVRFVEGELPAKNWLSKNQAYQALAEAANGEILLFCGVDVRFDRSTVRTLVGTLSARKKDMISVLPKGMQDNQHAGFVQPMRYWWELSLPRKLLNRPPALSTLWLIRKKSLQAIGGFKALSNTVIPEAYIARAMTRVDGYSFMRSHGNLVVHSTKKIDQQWETALRMRYPQLRKRPESVMLLTLMEICLFILPTWIFISGFFFDLGLLWTLAGLTQIILGLVHLQILKAWSVGQYSLLLAAFPITCIVEIAITQLSMWRYEFGKIEWKERNICIPVMHVIPRLPKV